MTHLRSGSKHETVIFRKWRGDCHPGERIFALFPFIPADVNGFLCTSYAHVGQHGGANYNHCIAKSRPAKPEEYADLLNELYQIGYNPQIRRRAPR